MAKSNKFKKGDLVSGNRFNGEPFIGIYEYEYDCGDHCVSNTTIKFCVHKNKIKKATPEEEELIKETIIKPLREMKKQKELEKLASEDIEEIEN